MTQYTLSPRQHQIALLVAQDLSNKQIAARLGMPVQTVKNTMCEIVVRLGVCSRVGVAVIVATQPIAIFNMNGRDEAGRFCAVQP